MPRGTVEFTDTRDDVDLGEDDKKVKSEDGDSGKKQKKKKKKQGGFHALNLSRPVFSGVMRMGYRFPTPVQRKAMPPVLAGRDVVAMARTGV